MKIGYYAPGWPPSSANNGIVTYAAVMADAMRALGRQATIYAPSVGDGEAGVDLVDLDRIPRSPFSRIETRIRYGLLKRRFPSPDALAHAIAAAVRSTPPDRRPDVLEVEESFGFAQPLQASLDIPVVVRLHGPHFLGAFGRRDGEDEARICNEGRAIRSAAAVTSPSSGLAAATAERYGVDPSSIATIYNPVAPPSGGRRWSASEANWSQILFVGRFDLRKGADVMLSAFAILAKRFPDLRLLMAGRDGGVELEDGRTLGFSAYAAERLPDDIRTRIAFLGPVDREMLDSLRLQSAACVSASRFETFNYAATEALALGCPTVVTRTFGPAEWLSRGDDIEIAETGDPDSLASILGLLLSDRTRTASMAAAGREAVLQVCGAERVARQSLAVYETALRRS